MDESNETADMFIVRLFFFFFLMHVSVLQSSFS